VIICWNEQGQCLAASSPEQWHDEEEEEEEEVCVCVCVWSADQSSKQHMGPQIWCCFTLSPVTSTHATHTTNFVCVPFTYTSKAL